MRNGWGRMGQTSKRSAGSKGNRGNLIVRETAMLEPLERRLMFASVTVITHGFQVGFSDSAPKWLDTMATSVAAKLDGANIYELHFDALQNTTWIARSLPSINNRNYVIEVNWAIIADQATLQGKTATSSVIAAKIANQLLNTTFGGRSLLDLPIHLIGHSRGASVMAQLARDLGTQGLSIDQATFVDPHPLTVLDLPPPNLTIDAPMEVTDNIGFSDNFYETSQLYPHGESVAGAHNTYLNASGIDHSGVHTYYQGTIDRNAMTDGDGGTIQDVWYNGSRGTTGYN